MLIAARVHAGPVEVRWGNIAPEGSSYDKGCGGTLKAEVERDAALAPRVRIKLFMGAVLGDEGTMLRHTQEGRLQQVAALTMSALAGVAPELGVFDLPFLFHDDAEVDAVFRSEKVRARVRALVEKHGLHLLGIAEAGWRNFAARARPIRVAADLVGLRTRAMPAPIQLQMWQALGALPQALGITELLGALEAGQIDAFDMQANFLFAASLHTQVRYYTVSRHMYQAGPVVASTKALPPPIMKGLVEAWSRTERACVEAIRAENRAVDAELAKAGVQVLPLAAEARAAFVQKLAPLRARFRKATTPAGRALLDAVEAVLEQNRR